MSGIKRINPRRPYQVTSEGVRRIVLGDAGQAGAPPTAMAPAQPNQKPVRLREEPTSWNAVIVHSDRGGLDDHACQAIAAAAILAPPETGVLALILGSIKDGVAALGIDRAIIVPGIAETFDPEAELALCSAVIESYSPKHIFMPDNVMGDGDLGRRLIASLGVSSATNVVEVNRDCAAIRWAGAAEFARIALPRIVLLAAGAVDAALPYVGAGKVVAEHEVPKFSSTAPLIRDCGTETLDASQISLEEAGFIVSAGNGVANTGTLVALARALGAAVGASRVAVDDGKFARHLQIGATGKSVSASAYVAVGISGAVQHLQGIKDCRHVIAINRDAGAPIVQRADLAIIGDAEDVMQALLGLISAARSAAQSPEAA